MNNHEVSWDYRVIGININTIQPSNPEKASAKLGEKLSKEFLEKEFPEEYVNNKSTNIALQCQQVIQIFGKKGWEHYQQSQLGGTAMLYFRRKKQQKNNEELTKREWAILAKLDELQHP